MPFILIALVAGLNLNGATSTLLEQDGLLSSPILVLTVLTIVRNARFSHFSGSYGLFVLFIVLYLVGGLGGNMANGTFDFSVFRYYFATLIFISACYFWIMAQPAEKIDHFLIFFKNLLLVTCLSIIFSDQFFQLAGQVPPIRKSGFFTDPNQAALSSLYCLVLVICYPAKRPIIYYFQLIITVLAIILPFSKTGMLLALPIIGLFSIQKLSLKDITKNITFAAVIMSGIWYAYTNNMIKLETSQQVRIEAVTNILNGNIGKKATTGRTEIWVVGLSKISENFPWGAGLGQFHAVKGGLRDTLTGNWLGIHNTYLLVLGEAGFIALSALMLFLFYIIWYGAKSRYRLLTIGFAIILLGNMASTHGVLAKRQVDLVIALMMVFAAKSRQFPQQTAASPPIPLSQRQIGL